MNELDHIRALYRQSLAEHGDSAAAVQWPKGRQDLRFTALTRHLKADTEGSLLDFGCGLGHLCEFMAQHFPNLEYAGVDILEDFVNAAKRRRPEDCFEVVQHPQDIPGQFDYVVASGVFNICFMEDRKENVAYLQNSLRTLFEKCRTFLSVNFMSDQVDFQQPGAYHQNVFELYQFCRAHLSPRLVIDQSDLPYEFTITVWKDTDRKSVV